MLSYAPPDPDGGTAANIIWVHDRFARFRVSVRKAARSPHAKSLAPLAKPPRSAHTPRGAECTSRTAARTLPATPPTGREAPLTIFLAHGVFAAIPSA